MGCCAGQNDSVHFGEKRPEENFSQAGGHVGRIIAGGDRVFKKCTKNELDFYSSLFDVQNACSELIEFRRFIPQYYGTKEINGEKYLILENLLKGYDHPSIFDCKIGKVTWCSDHDEIRTKNRIEKAEKTTTCTHGFRITGIEVKDTRGNITDKMMKKECYELINAKNIHEYFRKTVGNNRQMVEVFIVQIKELLEWFRKQKSKIFFTASVFFLTGKGKCQTKFIDFSHVFDAKDKFDTSNL